MSLKDDVLSGRAASPDVTEIGKKLYTLFISVNDLISCMEIMQNQIEQLSTSIKEMKDHIDEYIESCESSCDGDNCKLRF